MSILKKIHTGQIALIMILIMTVISAVAVSLAGRSTVVTRVQQLDTDSSDAMLVAQAGLEQAASKVSAVTGSLSDGKNYNVSLDLEGASGFISEQLSAGETLNINVTGATTLTGARVYWRPAVSSQTPSIFVSDVRAAGIFDYAYDSTGSNGFTKVTTGGNLNGVSFTYVTPSPITLVAGTSKSLRITVLGAPAFIGVEPVGGQFPDQIRHYLSVGDVGGSDSTIKYGIEYKESAVNETPLVFGYALFSAGSIMQ